MRAQQAGYDAALTLRFSERFGSAPSFFVRAPGRVNLMGDHIDYNLLSVLPMALPQSLCMAVRPRSDARIRLQSMDGPFAAREFEAAPQVTPFPSGDWGNYAGAAVQELAAGRGGAGLRGFDALIDSDIPRAAGLSSSSALVVATGLAFLTANQQSYTVLDLAERMARAERYVGTRGGGMDQAIILGAQAGAAARIDFAPLRITQHAVPQDWRFVVAYSGATAEKSGAAREAYNERAGACAQALRFAADVMGAAQPTYAMLLARHGAQPLLARVQATMPPRLFRRFRHVVTEAERVGRAEAALRAADGATFGRLMLESHASLRNDYEVSTAALDGLVEASVAAGAMGARLTGAGFGGCMVALTDARQAPALVEALLEHASASGGTRALGSDTVFMGLPGDGARVTRID